MSDPGGGAHEQGAPTSTARWKLVALACLVLAVLAVRPLVGVLWPSPAGRRVVLWHSQRGAEKDTLEALLRAFNEAHAGAIYVEPLAVPDGSFKDKLLRTVPRGGGPDLFVRPHNELGELVRERVVVASGPTPIPEADYLPGLLDGVSLGGTRYGLPLAYKALFVFYNTELLPGGPPKSLDALRALVGKLPEGSYPLAYDATTLFFHAPFFLASGATLLEGDRFTLFEGGARASFELPGELKRAGVLPPEASYNEAIRLFEAGRAAAIVCGPWYAPSGDVAAKKAWAIAPLFEHEGRPMGSLVTVEAAFVASSARDPEAAREVARYLAGEQGQAARYRELALPPVDARAYGPDAKLPPSKSPLAAELARVERASLEAGLVTPSSERMGAVWRPAEDVLRASLAGRSVPEAIDAATYTLSRVGGARVEGRDARPFGILLAVAIGAGVMLVARQVRRDAEGPEAARARQTGAWGSAALPYLAPGVSAAAVLVLAPVVAGVVMSLFEYDAGRFVFVGLDNFRELLFPPLARAFMARSFYFALAVTLLWTLLNVVLHVVLGVGAALLLRPAWVRFRTPLRLLLVLPWAIPNYITALMWKGMFHAQVGAINALLAPFGFSGFSWFDRFGTAFFANLVTNTWLGFPFMMVVTLGALSAIPKELEEAATLDGASRWQRLTRIVLPQIRPALLPSVILGSVWTFNMFNVVYLVSAGEPGSETDILISEAYRWAFERGQRYGFAAAYSVLIFGFLLVYSRLTSKLTAEEAR